MAAKEEKKVVPSDTNTNTATGAEEEDEYDDFIERDFSKWVNNRRLADVVFVVGAKKELFWGHRQLLAAGSDVFASMLYPAFGTPTTPAPQRSASLAAVAGLPANMLAIEVPDIEPDMFHILVGCIYTNHANIEIEQVGEIMKLSQKYCVDKLANLCGAFLQQGITIENAASMYEQGPRLLGDSEFGFDFIAENAAAVFDTRDFVNVLSKSRVISLVRSSELKIKEIDLFKAVVEWGKAECKRQEKKETKDELKSVLSEIIPYVRFPLMSVGDFSSFVQSSGVVPADDVLKLFTYLAQRAANTKPLPSISYSDEPRKLGGFEFVWKRSGARGAIDAGLTLRSTTNGYCCAIGDQGMKPKTGTYYWEIKVDAMASTSDFQMGIGVATASLNLESHLGGGMPGWAYCNQSSRVHSSSSSTDRFGETYTRDDIIGVLFDSNKGTLSYYKNRRALGQAWANISVEVFPAVHITTGGRLSIVKGAISPV